MLRLLLGLIFTGPYHAINPTINDQTVAKAAIVFQFDERGVKHPHLQFSYSTDDRSPVDTATLLPLY